jgi:pectate lyase
MKKMFVSLIAILALLSCGDRAGSGEDPCLNVLKAPDGVELHSAEDNILRFRWNTVKGADAYEWHLLKGDVEVVAPTRTTAHNAIIDGLTRGTTYRFAVRSVTSKASSDWSAFKEASTTGEAPVQAVAYEDFAMPSYEEDGKVRAFPGAEGGGMWVTGGRGGRVLHVTNLNDSGTGSLRWAVEQNGPRIIVFDVGGVIRLTKPLKIEKDDKGKDQGNLTIAGQTAPGDGICIRDNNVRISASNVIIRYLRFRMGDETATEDDALNLYTKENNIQDVIIDHCSLSWCTDECGSFYGMTNFTLQWCILSESLRNSVHDKGKHGYGGIWGGSNATYHHNLLAHHDSRNARLDHDYVSTLKGPVSLVNNVIYNWGDNTTYGGESLPGAEYKKYNIINSYYKPGPATKAAKVRFLDPTVKCDKCDATNPEQVVPGHFYMSGNTMEGYDSYTVDNWSGSATTASASLIATIKATAPFAHSSQECKLSLQSAENAYNLVLDYAGACLKRDDVDGRVTQETRAGNATYMTGSKGSTCGLIDSQSDVGGWPEYKGGTPVTDTDGDGIPDEVEDAWDLDKTAASDGSTKGLDPYGRYTNLEMYLHYLVRDIVRAQGTNATYTLL